MATKIIKKENDPIALRASIGGKPGIGFYCVFRGNKSDILDMLEQVINDLRKE